jgi:hypothetical protein
MLKSLRAVAYAALLFPVIASAQQNRTAVSVSGLDTNPCTVASPCRSFTAAMAQTNSGGEIIAVDSGGYGGFTVDRAVSVLAAPGVYAGVTAGSGDAITINAGASSAVVLRNLVINGMGTGHAGIAVTGSGSETQIENCVIQSFTHYGVIAFFNVRISDTTIRKCGTAIWIDNGSAAVKATVTSVSMKEMDGGDQNSPGTGILAFRNARVTVRNSVALNATNWGFRAAGGGALNLDSCTATNNGVGIQADQFGAAPGIVRISNNLVTGNVTGISNSTTIETWGNNKIAGNTTANLSGTALTAVAQN